MHAVLVLVACTLLIFAQCGQRRQFGSVSVMLLYMTASYLFVTIVAKYPPPSRKAVDCAVCCSDDCE
jgi:hypothetical protein